MFVAYEYGDIGNSGDDEEEEESSSSVAKKKKKSGKSGGVPSGSQSVLFDDEGGGDDDCADDEFVPTLDPITKRDLVDPVRNKVCRHIYGKEAILNIIKNNERARWVNY
jgi:hypothetical protein